MEDAYARFQADLAGVGQVPAPLAAPIYPAPAVYGAGSAAYAPPPMPAPTAYYPTPGVAPSRPPGGMGTIASIRAGQGLPVSGAARPGGAPGAAAPAAPGATGADGKPEKKKGLLREAAGKRWRDPTLDEWPENDYRIFVGDLGNEVNDDVLAKAFSKYPSFAKAKIVKDKWSKKSRGFGFVSFMDSGDGAKALKEMNGKYIGNRPVKLRKSSWQDRNPSPPPQKRQKKHGHGGGGGGGGGGGAAAAAGQHGAGAHGAKK